MNFEVAKECTVLSDEEKIPFPEIVSRLHKAGIESYYADLLTPSKTYYTAKTAYKTACTIHCEKEVAHVFSQEKVVSAIRQSQSGQIKYQEFLKKVMEAGVISYMVFIKGKRAIYFGRSGELHIEEFPKQ